jgi:GNAT superfamily N-acetyltransferase
MPATGDTASIIGSMVSLPPMPPDAWNAWRVASIQGYAADMVRIGSWPADGAVERATALFASIAPDGLETPGHEFRSVVTEAGEVVGSIWFAAEGEVGRGAAFIWDIVIDARQRGHGYGRAGMEALEPLARSLGYDTIRLRVLGDNAVARHLYAAVGYDETDLTMTKRLG